MSFNNLRDSISAVILFIFNLIATEDVDDVKDDDDGFDLKDDDCWSGPDDERVDPDGSTILFWLTLILILKSCQFVKKLVLKKKRKREEKNYKANFLRHMMITLLSFFCASFGVLAIFGGKKWRKKKCQSKGKSKPNIIE